MRHEIRVTVNCDVALDANLVSTLKADVPDKVPELAMSMDPSSSRTHSPYDWLLHIRYKDYEKADFE